MVRQDGLLTIIEGSSAGTPVPVTGTFTGTISTGTVTANQGAAGTGAWLVAAAQSGTWTVQPGNTANTTAWKVDGSAVTQPVAGPTAAGASLTANPVTGGALARTSPPTAVSNGQVVNLQANIYGENIVRHSLRETKGRQVTTITSSTAETTIVTADATYKLDLYGILLSNTSGSGTKVTLKDSTAGTTVLITYVPANDVRGFMLPACDALKQTAANNNWTATCGTSVASLEVTALTVQNL